MNSNICCSALFFTEKTMVTWKSTLYNAIVLGNAWIKECLILGTRGQRKVAPFEVCLVRLNGRAR